MISFCLTRIDKVRSYCLLRATPNIFFRRLYLERYKRLAIHFSVALVSALAFSLYFPLWVLAIGPVVYGFPHLVASLRYFTVPSGVGRAPGRIIFLVITLTGLLAAFRIFCLFDVLGIGSMFYFTQTTNWPEIAALVVTVFGISLIGRMPFQKIAKALVLSSPLIYFSLTAPLLTSGLLILGHNFVGFFYWIKLSRSFADRSVACTALFLFSFFNIYYF